MTLYSRPMRERAGPPLAAKRAEILASLTSAHDYAVSMYDLTLFAGHAAAKDGFVRVCGESHEM